MKIRDINFSMLRVSGRLLLLSLFMFVSQALMASSNPPMIVDVIPHQVTKDCEIGELCVFDDVEWLGSWELKSNIKEFGGFSSLHLNEDASQLVSVSDAGYALEMRLNWKTFDLESVEVERFGLVAGLTGNKKQRDIEAVALNDNGDWWLAFESIHRLEQRPSLWTTEGVRVHEVPDKIKATMPDNGGFESLVHLADDNILLLSEEGKSGKYRHWQAWLYRKDGFIPVYYPRYKTFSPTDATMAPNGRIMVLERSFSVITGLRTRFLWLEVDKDTEAGDILYLDEIVEFGRRDDIDNAEGIATFEHEGKIYILVISDDNFRLQQKTILSLFKLTE